MADCALVPVRPRCSAVASRSGSVARRCTQTVDGDSVFHCTDHAGSLRAAVARYKRTQHELDALIPTQPASWSALETWIEDAADGPRARRAARLLHRVAQRRFEAEITAHYGPPARMATAAVRVPKSLAGVTDWPDPHAPLEAGHSFAVRRCLDLRDALLARLPPPAPPATTQPAPAGGHPCDADDDGTDDDVGLEVPAPAPAVRFVAKRTEPHRLPAWSTQEHGAYGVYWAWFFRVAPVHPYANIRSDYDRGLPEVIDRLLRVLPSFAQHRAGRPSTTLLACVLDTIGNLDAQHAALFEGDMAWRQMLTSASLAQHTCRALLRRLDGAHDTMLPLLYGGSAAIARVVSGTLYADARANRRGRLAGAMAAQRCAVALLAYLRTLPIAQRAALGYVFAASRCVGALALAAACLGRCGADDETGLAWWHRFHEAPRDEATAIAYETGILYQVGVRKMGHAKDEAIVARIRAWAAEDADDAHPLVRGIEVA